MKENVLNLCKSRNIMTKIFSIGILVYLITKINIFIFNIINTNNREYRVCVCTLGKKENRYIREFVEHYKKYGVDKIYLYDNNNIDGERFEEVINEYIEEGFVEIIDFRGKIRPIYRIMNHCYRKNYKNYNWLIFFEIDEYIYLKDFNNVKLFLNNSRFNNCQKVQLNWIFHTDNNLLHYENRTLKERFPDILPSLRGKKRDGLLGIKTILRGHIPDIKINCVHTINQKLKSCDGFGNPKEHLGIETNYSDLEYYYIDHYYSKSTEEFINKLNKGDALFIDNRMDRIETYFSQNDVTNEKIDYFENSTGLNLSKFRNRAIKL